MAQFWYKFLFLGAPLVLLGCSEAETEENEIITVAGTVRLRRETELGFTTSGKVESVRYDEGDRVKRGAVLAALDNSVVSADLEAAKAERDRARSELGRIKSLYADGWVTKARLEQAEAASRSARARVKASSFSTRTSHIHAPSGGIILTRNVDAGQVVAAGQAVLVIGETSKGFVLKVPLTDANVSRVRVGMRANVIISAVGDEPFEAVISEIDGRADPRTGTFEVSFLLPANGRLRSGQLGTVDIEVSRKNDGSIAVPATAIFGVRSGEGLVYVVDAKNRVKQRAVVVGELTDSDLEISAGLMEGDVVVTRGIEKLRDGDEIKPIRAPK